MRSRERFLLDTNVVSEIAKASSPAGVRRFLEETYRENLFISVMTIGELRKGQSLRRRRHPEMGLRIANWIDQTERTFQGQILAVDVAVASRWAEFSTLGRSRPVVDLLIAATASVHGLTLVTRNIKDVEGLPVDVLNPWAG